MILLAAVLTQALHAVLVLAAAPVLTGLVRRMRARLAGRAGPPVMQPWRDRLRLLRKQPVLAENASFVFTAAPFVCFGCVLAAALLVPSFALGMLWAPLSDLIVIAGLLAGARAALALAGMDVGTAPGGMGASRLMGFAVFAEPGLLLVILVLALLAGGTSLDAVARAMQEELLAPRAAPALALLACAVLALAENGRLPFGDPGTCLEPAMVQEALALEYSGRHLALIEAAAELRLLLWLTLIAAVFIPFGLAPVGAGPTAWGIGMLAWAAKLAGLAIMLAVFETGTARVRVLHGPGVLGAALLGGLLAVALLFLGRGFA